MFNVTDITNVNNKIQIFFNSKEKFNLLKIELRLRDTERFMVSAFEDHVELDLTETNEGYQVEIDPKFIEQRFKMSNPLNQMIFIMVNANGKFYELLLNQKIKGIIKLLGNIEINGIAHLNLINRASNKLALRVNKKVNKNQLNQLLINEGSIIVDVESILSSTKESLPISNVYIKKRLFKNTLAYSDESIKLDTNDNGTFSMDLNKLSKFSFDDEVTILDIIVEIKENNISLESDIKKKNDIPLAEQNFIDHKMRFYWTASKGLSIRVERLYQVIQADSFDLNDHKIDIKIDKSKFLFENQQNVSLSCYRKNDFHNDNDLVPFKKVPLTEEDSTITLHVDLLDLFEEIKSNKDQNYEILFYDTVRYYKIGLNSPFEHTINTDNSKIKFSIHNEVTVNLKAINKKPVALGILGTCFTRSAFNSQDLYFNPDYKLNFSIEYSHFWPSLLSLTSKPIEFKREQFKDVPDKDFDHISREYDKSTFSALKDAKIEYLLIDFFVDAVHGARKLEDGRYLGQNGIVHNSAYYKNDILKNTKQFDYRHPEFWSLWKKACDTFIEEIAKIIDLNKVILVWGGLTRNYLDENRDLKNFIVEKKYSNTKLNFYNNIWDKMNNYFITKVPNAKVIDLRSYKYFADVNHPISFGPHHYESNYYKSIIGEIAKAVRV